MNRVLAMHRDEVAKIDEELVPDELLSAAQEAWDEAVERRRGQRRAQLAGHRCSRPPARSGC